MEQTKGDEQKWRKSRKEEVEPQASKIIANLY